LSSEIVTAGREETVAAILNWLGELASALSIRADTREEAIAFIDAVLLSLQPGERDQFLGRSAIVISDDAWRVLALHNNPLILLANLSDQSIAPAATARGHHVLIPLARDDLGGPNALELPSIARSAAAQALQAIGVPDRDVEELAALAHRSMPALRRRLATVPGSLTPEWARPEVGPGLIPGLLAGAWSERNEYDRSLIAELGNTDYAAAQSTLTRWSNEPDSPMRKTGEDWQIVARKDSWSLLSRYLDNDALERLEAAARKVLLTADPRFLEPRESRWLVPFNTDTAYSPIVRAGVAESVALLGSLAAEFPVAAAAGGQAWACAIVRGILNEAQDWAAWATLGPNLPALAEACPDAFLRGVDDVLLRTLGLVGRLLDEDSRELMGASTTSGLHHALKILAWDSPYLGAVADILGRLADEESQRGLHDAEDALRGIFLSWLPQTLADVEQRLAVIDAMRRRLPDRSWSTMLSSLPVDRGIGLHNPGPRWREWMIPLDTRAENAEVRTVTTSILQRLIDDAGAEAPRWGELIETAGQLPLPDFTGVIDALEQVEVMSGDIHLFTESLRRIITHHSRYPDAQWAMPRELLERLTRIADRYSPSDPKLRHRWLFGSHPELARPATRDYASERREILELQVAAIDEVFSVDGIDGVFAFARQIERPDLVGWAMGHSTL
jgi:hypothetical protein